MASREESHQQSVQQTSSIRCARSPQSAPAAAQCRPGSYSKGDAVVFWSETHKKWGPTTVTHVDDRGRIVLNVKPNTWLSTDVQRDRVRPRQQAVQKPPTSDGNCGSAAQVAELAQVAQPSMYSPDLARIAASLGLPDSHLLLGMSKLAVRRFCAEIGFPDRYDRKGTFAYLHAVGLISSAQDWISKAYPFSSFADLDEMKREGWGTSQVSKCVDFVRENDWMPPNVGSWGVFGDLPQDAYGVNGYDLVLAIRRWLHETGNTHKSVAEVCFERGDEGVGPAGMFISHVQSEPLKSTLAPIPDDVIPWLDYVSLRQLQSDFNPMLIARIIDHFGNTLAVEDAMRSYFTRAFCMLEVAVTPKGCLIMPVNEERKTNEAKAQARASGCAHDTEEYWAPISAAHQEIYESEAIQVRARNTIHIRTATTRTPEDLKLIHTFIDQNGGFDVIEANVKDALAAAGYFR